MADPKYADLPGIARNEPDVYETSDLPEDDQAEFEAEELTSTSVEHLIINPNAAYEKFRDKRLSTKGVDFSDRINKPRTTGYESGEYEILGEGLGAKETPQQRYQRLQHEVQELVREVEQIQSTVKESSAAEELTPMALARQVEGLKQQLVSSHLEKLLGPAAAVDFADPEGALAKRLLQQLEVAKCSKGGRGRAPQRPGPRRRRRHLRAVLAAGAGALCPERQGRGAGEAPGTAGGDGAVRAREPEPAAGGAEGHQPRGDRAGAAGQGQRPGRGRAGPSGGPAAERPGEGERNRQAQGNGARCRHPEQDPSDLRDDAALGRRGRHPARRRAEAGDPQGPARASHAVRAGAGALGHDAAGDRWRSQGQRRAAGGGPEDHEGKPGRGGGQLRRHRRPHQAAAEV
ncbi:unnamed protein product, partial [Bubo scandiacus]